MKGLLGTMFTTWLGLVALQALSTPGASGRVGQFFNDVDQLLERALDPTVPAIPDLTGKSGKADVADPVKALKSTTTTTPRLPVPGSRLPV